MKRFFIFITTIIIVLSMTLTGCSSGEGDRDKVLKDTMETIYEDLTSTFSGATVEYQLVSEYVYSWAKTNKLEVKENSEHYMVLSNPATEGCSNKESTVLQCSVKTNECNSSMQMLAVGLTALLGPEQHGNISLIITENNNGQYIGASSLDSRYLKCDNFINLDHSTETGLLTSGAKALTSTMTSSIATKAPSYKNAFTITMSMSRYTDPFNFENHYPNPIETIGSLLATEKSSGQLFELASFSCKAVDGYTPVSASAVVIVDDNDVESFKKKFDKSYESMQNKFDKLDDHFVYTLTETSVPSSVMTSSTSDNIISLMYTLKTGVFYQDEETEKTISVSDTSSVSTSDGKFQLVVNGRSLNRSSLQDMSDTYLTTSGLCDINYSASEIHDVWTSDSSKSLADYFINALSIDDPEKLTTFNSTECDIYSAAAPGLNVISYRFSIDNGESALKNITHFIQILTEQ